MEQYRDMYANFQVFSMYRYFHTIRISISFLNFYTEHYCDNNRMVKLIR
jgi:hypothetical protein